MSSSRPTYVCPRCGYNASHRYLFIQHLRRKTPCSRSSSEQEQEQVQEQDRVVVSDEDMAGLLKDMEDEQGRNIRTRTNGKTFSCDACGRCFNFQASLSRHRKSCPCCRDGKKEDPITALQKQCNDLQEEMRHLRDRPQVMTTNTYNHNNNDFTTTVNNAAHVHINALGKEDLSGISPELVDNCIRRTTRGLVELMEKIHFDTSASNQNLRASLSFPEQVEYFDGGGWKYGPRNRVVRQIVDSSHMIMSERYDDSHQALRNTMSRAMYDFVERWMNKMTRSNAQVYLDVMSEVYCSILNRTREINDDG